MNESTAKSLSKSSPVLPPAKPRSLLRQKGIGWSLAAVAAALLAYAIIVRPLLKGSDKSQKVPRSVTVVVEAARKSDLAIRILALGTVTPVNTVTVRSRVDGQLQKLFFDEGSTVEAGAPLADIDPRPFEAQKRQAEAQLARDKSLLENAKVDLERFNALLAENSISKQQATTQQALVNQYEAAIQVDQSQIETAALQLAYAHITAPISGRVGLRLVDTGNMIRATDASGLVVITQLRPITVIFSIPQDSLPKVLKRFRDGEPIAIEAFDRDGRTLLAKGKLVTIDNQIDPATGTVKMRGEFPNDDETLFPNQFVNVQLLADQVSGATVVSTAAVQRGSIGAFVYVISEQDGQKTASVRTVEIGPSERGYTAISKGISPGDLVVTDGVDKLRDGATVEVVTRTPAAAGSAPDDKTGKGSKGAKHRRDGASSQPN